MLSMRAQRAHSAAITECFLLKNCGLTSERRAKTHNYYAFLSILPTCALSPSPRFLLYPRSSRIISLSRVFCQEKNIFQIQPEKPAQQESKKLPLTIYLKSVGSFYRLQMIGLLFLSHPCKGRIFTSSSASEPAPQHQAADAQKRRRRRLRNNFDSDRISDYFLFDKCA